MAELVAQCFLADGNKGVLGCMQGYVIDASWPYALYNVFVLIESVYSGTRLGE